MDGKRWKLKKLIFLQQEQQQRGILRQKSLAWVLDRFDQRWQRIKSSVHYDRGVFMKSLSNNYDGAFLQK